MKWLKPKKPLTYSYLHQFNEFQQTSFVECILQIHQTDVTSTTDLFTYSNMFCKEVFWSVCCYPWKARRKTLSHPKTLKDLASLERPWVTENLWKNWRTYQTFVGEKKIIQNKPTARWKLFSCFYNQVVCFRRMFHILLHIIFPSYISFTDFAFSNFNFTDYYTLTDCRGFR